MSTLEQTIKCVKAESVTQYIAVLQSLVPKLFIIPRQMVIDTLRKNMISSLPDGQHCNLPEQFYDTYRAILDIVVAPELEVDDYGYYPVHDFLVRNWNSLYEEIQPPPPIKSDQDLLAFFSAIGGTDRNSARDE